MNLNTVTFEGNLADTPKLIHVSNSVTAVLEAVILVNRRTKDSAGKWCDGETQKKRTQDIVIVDTIGASLRYIAIQIEPVAAGREGDN